MEPARFLVFIEVNKDDTEEFENALRIWFTTKCSNVKFAIRPVILEEDRIVPWTQEDET